ncbi:putative deoxyribonuclease TATDN2 [Pecten maximus]|uniref:putative deoxyribonuclease TATDN2 n=1 Tax=Pecten maximus TaxID=6579 RepID=UPI001458AC48|nr:putative deoxyribonuclease TATDN2 [Pecten maximus]
MVFSDVSSNVPNQIEALKSLVCLAYGRKTTLQAAVDHVNESRMIPEGSVLDPCHLEVFRQACSLFGVRESTEFSLHPVNFPAVLLFWRCLIAMLDVCTPAQRTEFYNFRVVRLTVEPPFEEAAATTLQPASPESSAEAELLPGLEEFYVVDSDDEETAVPTLSAPSSPDVIDSHFNLDRTSRQIWGKSSGHTVEDLLAYSYSDAVTETPSIPVNVVGGIVVFSEPNTYPPVDFESHGPWRVAVGVHPKHYETLTIERNICLQRLLDHPKVVALGECGLDRTIPISRWSRQEEVFVKLLRMARPDQPLVLHLRGVKGDSHGTDVYRSALGMVEDVCSSEQRIHVNCFMGKSDIVRAWLRKFPNTYFGVTAAVRVFDNPQLEGFKAIPWNRSLLETDSPYFSPGKARVSTPAYIGETAAVVAAHLDARTPEILECATANARELYQL